MSDARSTQSLLSNAAASALAPALQKVAQCSASNPPSPAPNSLQPKSQKELAPAPAEKPDPLALTDLQLRAIHLLLQGKTNTATARSLGIPRVTLYRWQTFHPRFQSELGRQRREAFDATRQQLRTLLTRSVKLLGKHLTSDNPDRQFRAAQAILSHCGPRSAAPDADEPTHPNEVIDTVAEHVRKQAFGPEYPNMPLTPNDRHQALLYLTDNLAAPHNPGDPPEPPDATHNPK